MDRVDHLPTIDVSRYIRDMVDGINHPLARCTQCGRFAHIVFHRTRLPYVPNHWRHNPKRKGV